MNEIPMAWAVGDWGGLETREELLGKDTEDTAGRDMGSRQAGAETLASFSRGRTSVICSDLGKEASIHFTTLGIMG